MKKLIITMFVAAIAFGFDAVQETSGIAGEGRGNKHPVVFIHGGAIDDYVSYLLLTTVDKAELRGVIEKV